MKHSASQRRVLAQVAELNKATGLPATIREVADACGYRAHSGVVRHLDTLEAAGAITKTANVSRSIQITPKGKRVLANVR